MNQTSFILQGLLVGVIFLFVAFVALSWSQKPTKAAWAGEDPSTSFMYCVLRRHEAPQEFQFRLSRLIANHGALSTITLSKEPDLYLDVVVHEGRSFASPIAFRERVSLQLLEYEQLVQQIADTGLFQKIPNTHSNVEDGIWLGFEYMSQDGTSLGYGNNDSDVLDSIVGYVSQSCREPCRQAFELAESIDVARISGGLTESCVELLRQNDMRVYL